jgi:hypothetical protein
VKPYRPSGRIPFGGLIGLILATSIGSVVIGGLVFAVSHFIYLIVLFPFLMGALGGGILIWVVSSSKIRSPIIAGLFGLLMGVGIIGVNRFAEYYIDFRNGAREAIVEESGDNITDQELDEFIDFVLEDETGSTGFIGYLKYSASLGTTITRTASSSSSPLTLDETATWVYWGVELLIVAGVAAAMAFNAARKPFNEDAGDWYSPLGQWVGSVDWKARKEFYRNVQGGDANAAFRMVTTQALPAPRVDVFVLSSPNAPTSESILDIKEIRMNRRRELPADKMKRLLSPNDLNFLTRTVGGQQTSSNIMPNSSSLADSLE